MRTLVALLLCSLLVGCAGAGPQQSTGLLMDTDPVLKAGTSENLNRFVAQRFARTPTVLRGDIAVSKAFFERSETVIVVADEPRAQLRAASIAVVAHAPVLTMVGGNRSAVLKEITRLGARVVLVVGQVHLATTGGDLTVMKDPGTFESLGELTSLEFRVKSISGDFPQEVAALSDTDPVALQLPVITTPSAATSGAFPLQSRVDAGTAPIVLATGRTSLAAIATARAFGATVKVVDDPDPRYNRDTMTASAGLVGQPLIALGGEFGRSDELAGRLRIAATRRAWQPGTTEGLVGERDDYRMVTIPIGRGAQLEDYRVESETVGVIFDSPELGRKEISEIVTLRRHLAELVDQQGLPQKLVVIRTTSPLMPEELVSPAVLSPHLHQRWQVV